MGAARARPGALVYSLSKSFTSTALAFAVAEGLLGLDDTVLSHFPELDAEVTDPRSRATTLRHLAMMASGHDRDRRGGSGRRPWRPGARLPDGAARGTSRAAVRLQPAVHLHGRRRDPAGSGSTLVDYLRPRLFEPLGIGEVGWQEWPPGRAARLHRVLHATTEDIAKLGQLYLQRGAWEGTAAARPRRGSTWRPPGTSPPPQEDNPDWRQGYGFQFWLSRHGYRGDGAYGQFCVVLPEHDIVVAMTAGTEDMQAVLRSPLGAPAPRPFAPHGRPGRRGRPHRAAGLSGPAAVPRGRRPRAGQLRGDRGGTGRAHLRRTRRGHRPGVTLVESDDAVTFPTGVGSWASRSAVRRAATRSRCPPAPAASTARSMTGLASRCCSSRPRTGWTSSATRRPAEPRSAGASRRCTRAPGGPCTCRGPSCSRWFTPRGETQGPNRAHTQEVGPGVAGPPHPPVPAASSDQSRGRSQGPLGSNPDVEGPAGPARWGT